ncbi:LysR family transcriptional regulator [Vibrio sp. DW001]|uniref:LysR family transcriptional regulator n=1 Tax=Vibrio sp. DW001 TaxID=2912315 RepID=UPI0023AE80E0|nr:LysR family transcriptional regulator [Vibrio sp. DW001]WED25330.1 LysR family transcriptional regulator [Vibrio sp. DW001]
MDVDQLRAFCQLAKSGNYRMASEQLFITQSALTKKIQRLENDINSILFERGRSGASLTQVGKTILPEAKRLVASFKAFEGLTRSVTDGTKGHLGIGFGISTYHQAPKYISTFKQNYPDVHITLNDIPSHHQTKLLLSGELQLSFNRLPVNPPLKSIRLFSDQLVVAVHEGELIDSKDSWKSLYQLNYMRLTPSRGQGLSGQIDSFLRDNQLQLNVEQESDDILTLLSLVSARLGYTVIPASAKLLSQPQIRYIPLSGPSSKWDVGLIWNNSYQDPVRQQFIDTLICT